MKTIAVASTNPVKVKATLAGFRKMFPDETFQLQAVSVASGVSEQPATDEETYQGACGRARNAQQILPEADFWVGIEGGVQVEDNALLAFAWIVVRGRDRRSGSGRTASFLLPEAVASLVRQGKELGEADDLVFERSNSKQENGAVGILTGDVIDRAALYEPAVVLALIPFKNPALYPPDEV